ncbi:unnamed protein product [Brassicogethes aeneus]|nr:unnamed protein product [Brassicogethes aeneus]
MGQTQQMNQMLDSCKNIYPDLFIEQEAIPALQISSDNSRNENLTPNDSKSVSNVEQAYLVEAEAIALSECKTDRSATSAHKNSKEILDYVINTVIDACQSIEKIDEDENNTSNETLSLKHLGNRNSASSSKSPSEAISPREKINCYKIDENPDENENWNYSKIKRDLIDGDPKDCNNLLKSLRWLLTSEELRESRENILNCYIRNDVLFLVENTTDNLVQLFLKHDHLPLQVLNQNYRLSFKSTGSIIQENMARMTNTFASFRLGRDYLNGKNCAVLKSTFLPQILNNERIPVSNKFDILTKPVDFAKLTKSSSLEDSDSSEPIFDLEEKFSDVDLTVLNSYRNPSSNDCLIIKTETFCRATTPNIVKSTSEKSRDVSCNFDVMHSSSITPVKIPTRKTEKVSPLPKKIGNVDKGRKNNGKNATTRKRNESNNRNRPKVIEESAPFCYMELCRRWSGNGACNCSKCSGGTRYSCGCYEILRKDLEAEMGDSDKKNSPKLKKYFILASAVLAIAHCAPGIISGHDGGGLSLGGGGGGGGGYNLGGHGSGISFLGGHGLGEGGNIGGHQQGGGESGGGDFHHGVSIVGLGGGQKSQSFDLTDKIGNHGHKGPFGGSFVASSKYSSGGHGGGGDGGSGHLGGGYGGHSFGGGEGYQVSEGATHYSDVLGADQGHGGFQQGGGQDSFGHQEYGLSQTQGLGAHGGSGFDQYH